MQVTKSQICRNMLFLSMCSANAVTLAGDSLPLFTSLGSLKLISWPGITSVSGGSFRADALAASVLGPLKCVLSVVFLYCC